MGTELIKHKVATAVVGLAPRLHLDRSTSEGVIRGTAFVARCSSAATLAYLISFWIGLPYPVWSTISALVVSHEKLSETRSLLNNRILGTVLGIGIAIAIAAGTSQFGATVSTQIAMLSRVSGHHCGSACGTPRRRARSSHPLSLIHI